MNEHSVREFFLLFSSLGQTMSISAVESGETHEILFFRSPCSRIMDRH